MAPIRRLVELGRMPSLRADFKFPAFALNLLHNPATNIRWGFKGPVTSAALSRRIYYAVAGAVAFTI
jgi:hypothetical protein